jgi:hypothetical protein
MENLSRRSFLQKGSMAVGAAGVAVAAPTLGRAARSAGIAPAAGRLAAGGASEQSSPAGAEDGKADGPIVAHVRDIRSGEIDLFVGTRRVTVKDPTVAARLYRATH